MWNKDSRVLLICAFLVTFIYACRTQRHLSTDKPIRLLTTGKIVDSVNKHKIHFHYFTSKLSVDVESPKLNESFKATIRIAKDSLIWISITKLSIPVAVAAITKDSVKVIMKYGDGKGYYPRGMHYLNELFDTELDYYMLQDLLTGNPMSFDSVEKFRSPSDSGFYYLTTLKKRKLRRALEHDRVYKKHAVIYQYKFYPRNFKPYQVWINDVNDTTTFDLHYNAYDGLDSIPTPASLQLDVSKGNKKVKLTIDYKRTKLDEKPEFPFNIPEGYEKK